MIKRLVILEDEQLVVQEIDRQRQRAAALPAPAAVMDRRKAARTLAVSYKTLLNKIKECGISRP